MERERIEAEGGILRDEDAIAADINHVVNSRIAKITRKSYDDYTVRLIMFLFDHREKFPALIPPGLLTKLEAAALSDLQNTTRAGRPKAIRKFIRKAIRDSFQTIDPADPSTHPITLERLEFKTLAHFLSTFSRRSPKPPSKAMAKTLCCHISPETTPVKLFTSVSAPHLTTV